MCTRKTWRLALAAAILPTLSYAAGFGDPLPGLTPDQQTAFQDGKTAFTAVEAATEGLGPIFNENSCAACHVGPAGTAATGAVGGTTERLETRFGKSVYDAFDPGSRRDRSRGRSVPGRSRRVAARAHGRREPLPDRPAGLHRP